MENTNTLSVIKNDTNKGYSIDKAIDTIKKINEVANNCDYARALVVNSIAKSDLEDWKKPLIEKFGYSKDYLNKLVKVADKFLYLESSDIDKAEKDGQNVYDLMVSTPSIVKGLHDMNEFDFSVSQMLELVFLDDEVLKKELESGNIKANQTVKEIRDKVDKYKTKKNTSKKSNEDKGEDLGFKCDNDKERINMCVKLMESITTDTIKKHKNYAEILKALEMFKEYAK